MVYIQNFILLWRPNYRLACLTVGSGVGYIYKTPREIQNQGFFSFLNFKFRSKHYFLRLKVGRFSTERLPNSSDKSSTFFHSLRAGSEHKRVGHSREREVVWRIRETPDSFALRRSLA